MLFNQYIAKYGLRRDIPQVHPDRKIQCRSDLNIKRYLLSRKLRNRSQ